MKIRIMNKKVSRLEQRANHNQIVEHRQKGEGLFVFRNRNKATLTLPKVSADGKKTIGPSGEWEGDSYFMDLVRKNEAILVRTIKEPSETILQLNEQKEYDMQEEKLILDQPDTVTSEGTVEQVKATPEMELEENEKNIEDVLLTEDPMDGVEIIRD